MSLANRLAQLDQELDAFQKSPEVLEGVRTRLLAGRSTDLAVVDGELEALAADVAGLDAVLDAARQQAASRGAELAAEAAARDERARAARAEVDARVAALAAEQDAAREARAAREAQAARDREAAAAQRAQQAAADQAQREAAAAQRAEREAAERAARAEQAERERATAAARPAPSMDESAATTLSQLLADELEEEQGQPAAASADTLAVESASDDTDLFSSDLFGDLGADAFDAPQDRLDDVVSSDDRAAQPSAFVDLASLLEQEEARSAPSAAAPDTASESDDLMSALFADSPEEPAPPVAEARPKTVPPPVPTPGSVRPPALPAAVLEGARESFEDLSDEIDMMEVDDFEIVIDDSGDEGTGTELDGPGLSAEELAPDAMHTVPDHEPEEGEKKGGFFKKLFR